MIKIIQTKKIVEATCDICGNDCMKALYFPNDEGDTEDHEISNEFEGMTLTADWGFASEKDGERWDAVVCEDCVDKHLTPLINFMKTPNL